MLGQMQQHPLMVAVAADARRAASRHHRGGLAHHRGATSTAPPTPRWSAALAGWCTGLHRLGIEPGDRVGTLAWNGFRHLEIYYAVAGMQAVCHTINPRLHPDDIAYIVNHAEDRVLCADTTFVPLL